MLLEQLDCQGLEPYWTEACLKEVQFPVSVQLSWDSRPFKTH